MTKKIGKVIIYKERIKNILNKIYLKFLPQKKEIEFENKIRSDAFQKIYDEKRWGKDNISGGGSTIDFTKKTKEIIYNVIEDFKIKSILDAACGDFEWMPLLLQKLNKDFIYIGCDIVQTLVNQHKINYPQFKFYHLDFVNDKLPVCDLIFCRDALQHLPVNDIKKALKNFSKSGSKYLLTTTHIRYPEWKNKRDIRVAQCRDRNLLLKPFSLEDPIVIYNESQISHKFLGLWKLPLEYIN